MALKNKKRKVSGEVFARRRRSKQMRKSANRLLKTISPLILHQGFVWYIHGELPDERDDEFINRLCSQLKISPYFKQQVKDVRFYLVDDDEYLILAKKKNRSQLEVKSLEVSPTHIKDEPLYIEGAVFSIDENGVITID